MARCETKRKFKTKSGADRALWLIWKQAISQGSGSELPCRSYLCEICSKWHLTSKAKKESAIK